MSRAWSPSFRSDRSLPNRFARIAGRFGRDRSSAAWFVRGRGWTTIPRLKRDPRDDPRPEVKAAKITLAVIGRETRKERRKRLFAAHLDPASPEPTAAVE